MFGSRLLISCLIMAASGLAGTTAGRACDVFPAANIWNTPIANLPLDRNSAAYVKTIGANLKLHPDFGSGVWPPGSDSPIGIPFMSVPGTQPKVKVSFDYSTESDRSPYPIPANAPIEGGPDGDGDRHVLAIDRSSCLLYELFAAHPRTDGTWHAGSGAIFDLKANKLRPAGWTSADAAGLPIYPGLVKYSEVAAGEIKHALRFTAPQTRKAYVWPARHYASDLTGKNYPPMGQRFRLKANFDISGFSPQVQVILLALKRYGMILADNGSSWYISGAPDKRWNNDVLHEIGRVAGSSFEAVDASSLMVSSNSAQARLAGEPKMTVQISAIKNGAGAAVRFSRTGDTSKQAVIFYSAKGTADSGAKYALSAGSVTLPAGTAAKNVTIGPYDEITKENLTVRITILGDPYCSVGSSGFVSVSLN